MNDFILELSKQRIALLEKELKKVERTLKKTPDQVVHLAYSHGRPQFYLCNKGEKSGQYVRKSQYAALKKILQNDYDRKVREAIVGELTILRKLVEKYPKITAEKVYDAFPEAKRTQIVSRFQSDEDFAREWVEQDYSAKEIDFDERRIMTEKGERVRSKSEKMIADKLAKMGIPYRYECPLALSDGRRIYPDFTLLDIKNRREIYLEHLGMLDYPDYSEMTVTRLNWYAKEGIFPGKGLLITWETLKEPFDVRILERMLEDLEPFETEITQKKMK